MSGGGGSGDGGEELNFNLVLSHDCTHKFWT